MRSTEPSVGEREDFRSGTGPDWKWLKGDEGEGPPGLDVQEPGENLPGFHWDNAKSLWLSKKLQLKTNTLSKSMVWFFRKPLLRTYIVNNKALISLSISC